MDFPWDLGLGSLIANFYFLFDYCKSNEYCSYNCCKYLDCNPDAVDIISNYKAPADTQMCRSSDYIMSCQKFLNDPSTDTANEHYKLHHLLKSFFPNYMKQSFSGLHVTDMMGMLGYSTSFDWGAG